MNKKLIVLLMVMVSFSSLLFGCTEKASSDKAYPDRPVRVIVSYGTGGSNDLTSRVLMEEVGKILGQPFNVENIAGASGTVGSTVASTAEPDGYTIFFAPTDPIAVQPNLIDVEYSLDDFKGVAGVSYDASVLAVRADSPWETLDDLLKEENTDTVIDRGHSGVGGVAQIFLELFFGQTNIKTNDVPFDGGAAAITALLGGHVDVVGGTAGAMMPYIESGELRILAAASDERLDNLPDVPTFKEKGYDVSVGVEFFVLAPNEVPDDIVKTLETAVMEAAASEEFKAFVDERGQQLIIRNGGEIMEKNKKDFEMFNELLQ
ncbi:tricarboxylate transport protein TctC [Gracilibacillus boraciitolerans JCM 21714]|uniref:Tricarboxylate transport protein TctC n=1 Tax=Gracilibacillus boraciitolerans JCM 21714 TaxID=1298598 RepID=W4VM86_9BACI|nr:tripartite tricarboxylate transporter substrate binding protein [Gracilibacillus boraciitolerans]GAE94480.1 tricarboxylate transport protein TctC [Gracilibacillus boraciitolerans JCM 21714]